MGWCSVPWHGEPAVQRGTGLCVVATAFPGTSCSFLGLLGGWVPHAERRTGPGPREDLAGVGRALGTGAQRESMVAAVQWSSVLGPAVHGVSSGRRRGVRPHLRAEVAGLPEGPGSTPQWAPDMVRVAPCSPGHTRSGPRGEWLTLGADRALGGCGQVSLCPHFSSCRRAPRPPPTPVGDFGGENRGPVAIRRPRPGAGALPTRGGAGTAAPSTGASQACAQAPQAGGPMAWSVTDGVQVQLGDAGGGAAAPSLCLNGPWSPRLCRKGGPSHL